MGLHFDPTISIGTILNVLGMFIAAFLLWHKIDLRLTKHDFILDNISQWKVEIDNSRTHLNGETVKRLEEKIASIRREVDDYHRRVGSVEQKLLLMENKND